MVLAIKLIYSKSCILTMHYMSACIRCMCVCATYKYYQQKWQFLISISLQYWTGDKLKLYAAVDESLPSSSSS